MRIPDYCALLTEEDEVYAAYLTQPVSDRQAHSPTTEKDDEEGLLIKEHHSGTAAMNNEESASPSSSSSTAAAETEASEEEEVDVIINMWLGPSHTVSPLHHDPYHNLLAQVHGYKYVRLYALEHSQALYPMTGRMYNNR